MRREKIANGTNRTNSRISSHTTKNSWLIKIDGLCCIANLISFPFLPVHLSSFLIPAAPTDQCLSKLLVLSLSFSAFSLLLFLCRALLLCRHRLQFPATGQHWCYSLHFLAVSRLSQDPLVLRAAQCHTSLTLLSPHFICINFPTTTLAKPIPTFWHSHRCYFQHSTPQLALTYAQFVSVDTVIGGNGIHSR